VGIDSRRTLDVKVTFEKGRTVIREKPE